MKASLSETTLTSQLQGVNRTATIVQASLRKWHAAHWRSLFILS